MVSIGKICGAVGIKGEIKVLVSSDFEEHIKKNSKKMEFFDDKGNLLKLIFRRKQSKFLIFSVDGIIDRNEAEKLEKTQVCCKDEDLPQLEDDEFYTSDLIGLHIYENDIEIGKIVNIGNFGAGDIVEIELIDGSKILYPFTKKIFHTIEKDKILVEIPKFL